MTASTPIEPKSNGLSPLVSMVQGAKGQELKDFPADRITASIASGRWKENVEPIRQTYADTLAKTGSVEDAKDAVRPAKSALLAVLWSGTFSGRGDGKLKVYSGLVCADLDDLPASDLPALRDRLAQDQHASTVFLSPTGSGLKVPFRVAGGADRHYENFLAVRRYVKDAYGLEVDEACKNPERLCFVSYDPDAQWNPDAVPLEPLPLPEVKAKLGAARKAAATPAKGEAPRQGEREPVTVKLLRELLAVIPADDRQVWFTVLGAVKLWGEDIGDADLAYDLADEWSQASPKYNAETQEKTWESLKREAGDNVATIGSLFKLAKEHGWQGKPPSFQTDGEAKGAGIRTWAEIAELLRARRFWASRPPPPVSPVYRLAGAVIGTPGNLATITAAVKTGKTAVIEAMMASVMGEPERDYLGFWSENPRKLALLHFDSEQAPGDHWRVVARALTRIYHDRIEQSSGESVRRLEITQPNENATRRFFCDRL